METVESDAVEVGTNKKTTATGFEGGEPPGPGEVSTWVLSQMKEVSSLLWVSFVGHEKEAMRLFSAIEASWRGSALMGKQIQVVGQKGKGARELQNLQCISVTRPFSYRATMTLAPLLSTLDLKVPVTETCRVSAEGLWNGMRMAKNNNTNLQYRSREWRYGRDGGENGFLIVGNALGRTLYHNLRRENSVKLQGLHANTITGTSRLKFPFPSLDSTSSASGEVPQPCDEKSSTTTAPLLPSSAGVISAVGFSKASFFEEEVFLPKQEKRWHGIASCDVVSGLKVGSCGGGLARWKGEDVSSPTQELLHTVSSRIHSQVTMLEGKAVIGETDMLQTMQLVALELAAKALDFFDVTEPTQMAAS
ncbi:hypothetical protein TEA_015414 [Camellia sinensis var. sinensis]|uniref:Uncharacterized protein n=1 Tax=Camellia sinensis var. sinensis TaxID=542762 RepID=A0A4S4EMD0_CAMSN|nr:hypothetical protein TEA_015414 [Camellia sinensis var. sinensis]